MQNEVKWRTEVVKHCSRAQRSCGNLHPWRYYFEGDPTLSGGSDQATSTGPLQHEIFCDFMRSKKQTVQQGVLQQNQRQISCCIFHKITNLLL